MLTGVPDRCPAWSGSDDAGRYSPLWPWSCRIAGATSSWPAVEVYEAGSLLDVVGSTRLAACVLRGARAVRGAGGRRLLAWGRLPLTGSAPAVEFSRGRVRVSRQRVPLIRVTAWCWLAVAEGRYDAVTVRYGDTAVRRRLRASRSCR